MDYRSLILDALTILYKREIAEKEVFKARAYEKVITQLKASKEPIRSFEDVAAMEGIGKKIALKIKEIIETGALKAAERTKEEYPLSSLDAFQNIYGVGPKKAAELIDAGIRTIAQLRDAVAKQPKLLNAKQLIGLQYYEDLIERIPRAEMLEHKKYLTSAISDFFPFEVVGSFRRGAESSGDIDVLLHVSSRISEETAIKRFNACVKTMQESGYIQEILAMGDKKCMAICHLPSGKSRRLDLLMTPDEEYAYALLYFTGSDLFNIQFRNHAMSLGYKMNEHTMVPIREGVVTPPRMKEEKDIFTFLGLAYVDPKDRVQGAVIPLGK